LYHHLISRRSDLVDPNATIEVAYFLLPRSVEKVKLEIGRWQSHHLEHAIMRAQEVVREVRAGEYTRGPAPKYDDFARICQKHVIGPHVFAGEVPA